MLELPGWSRSRIRFAPRADVEAARWRVYAGVLESTVNFDVEGKELDLAEADASPKEAKRYQRKRLGIVREAVKKMRVARDEARALLLLDDEETSDG